MRRAQIEKEGQAVPIELDLLDNGKDADITANDGIYASFFARFDDDGRYTLKCQVVGDDSSEVNGGFIATKRLTDSRMYPVDATQGAPICCGSNTVSDLSVPPVNTGPFEREAVGGSFRVLCGKSNKTLENFSLQLLFSQPDCQCRERC